MNARTNDAAPQPLRLVRGDPPAATALRRCTSNHMARLGLSSQVPSRQYVRSFGPTRTAENCRDGTPMCPFPPTTPPLSTSGIPHEARPRNTSSGLSVIAGPRGPRARSWDPAKGANRAHRAPWRKVGCVALGSTRQGHAIRSRGLDDRPSRCRDGGPGSPDPARAKDATLGRVQPIAELTRRCLWRWEIPAARTNRARGREMREDRHATASEHPGGAQHSHWGARRSPSEVQLRPLRPLRPGMRR